MYVIMYMIMIIYMIICNDNNVPIVELLEYAHSSKLGEVSNLEVFQWV